MTAELATFNQHLQEVTDAGQISPLSAWMLEWELLVLADRPWSPGVREIHMRVELFHWETDRVMRQ